MLSGVPFLDPWVAGAAVGTAATVVAVRDALAGHRAGAVVQRLRPTAVAGSPPDWFLGALSASGLRAGPAPAWAATRRVLVVAVVVLAWRWPQFVVAAGAVVAVGRRVRRRTSVRAEQRSYDATLISVIDGLVSRLATGTSLAVALREATVHPSPVGRDLAAVVRRHDHGQGLQTAVDHWAQTRATNGVRLLADSLAIAGRSGGSQRSALVGVQATLRDHEALGREVRALGSQARTSGVVLAVTPAAFAGVVALVDHRVAAFFGTPAGWACVVGGVALNAVGALWMHRLAEALA